MREGSRIMGQIRIETWGSFPNNNVIFSAQKSGHAQAITAAINWLSRVALPKAIELDHKLHSDGVKPDDKIFGPYPKEQ